MRKSEAPSALLWSMRNLKAPNTGLSILRLI
jgi:hypothetical protein